MVNTPGGSPESNSPEDQNNRKLVSQRSTDSDKNSPTQVSAGLVDGLVQLDTFDWITKLVPCHLVK